MNKKPLFAVNSWVWLQDVGTFDLKKCKIRSIRRLVTRYLGLFAREDYVTDWYYLSDTRGRDVHGLTTFSEDCLFKDELVARKKIVSDLGELIDKRSKELRKFLALYKKHIRRIEKLEKGE